MDKNYLWVTCVRQYRENVHTKTLDYTRQVEERHSTILERNESYVGITKFLDTLRNEYDTFFKAFKKEPCDKSCDICVYLYTGDNSKNTILYRMGVFSHWEDTTKVYYKDIGKQQESLDTDSPFTSDHVIQDIASRIDTLLKVIPD